MTFMISKKSLLVGSGLVTLALLTFDRVGTYWMCDNIFPSLGGSIGRCPDVLADGMTVLFPVLFFFFLSLLTYKMRDEVYRAWSRFAMVWVPLSMFLILIAPEYSADWMFPVDKSSVAFFSSAAFVVISLLVIAWKYAATWKT